MIEKEVSLPKNRKPFNRAPVIPDRGYSAGLPIWAPLPQKHQIPKIIAVGGGKGGVGKSLVSANVGCELAKAGYRTLVIDLDMGGANLHTYFGQSFPNETLSKYFHKPRFDFTKLITPSPISGLAIIAGACSTESNKDNLTQNELARFWKDLCVAQHSYSIDYIIIDLGAGTQKYTIELFSTAVCGILTVLPEPTSIENAYVFLRAHLWKLISNTAYNMGKSRTAEKIQRIIGQTNSSSLNDGYLSKLRSIYDQFPEEIRQLGSVVSARTVGVLVNQARGQEDKDICQSIQSICQQFFGLQASSLGSLNYDEAAWKSLRNKRLLSKDFPHSIISQRIKTISQNIIELTNQR